MASLTKAKNSQYAKYQSTEESMQSAADPAEDEQPTEVTTDVKSSSMHDMVKHLQRQAEEVGKVMKDNMTKVLERHDRLVELEDRSQSLEESAEQFRHQTQRLRKKTRWETCNVRLCLFICLSCCIICGVVVVLMAASGIFTWKTDVQDSATPTETTESRGTLRTNNIQYE